MYCYNCGARVSDGAKYCSSCGTKQRYSTAPPRTASPKIDLQDSTSSQQYYYNQSQENTSTTKSHEQVMDYSVDTPYHSYSDIQNAVNAGIAVLSYKRTTANSIAASVNPIYYVLFLIIPIVSVLTMLIVCQILSISRWVLLFGLVTLLLYAFVPRLKVLFAFISLILIILPLFVFQNSMWLLAIGVGIIGMLFGYYIWWSLIAAKAHIALMNDEELFESVWKSGTIAIKTGKTIEEFYTYGCHRARMNR